MKIPKSFLSIDFASSNGAVDALVRDATRFLRRLASDLHLADAEYSIRIDKSARMQAFIALHSDALYVHIRKASHRQGIAILYRTCRGREDHAGGADNFVSFAQLMSDAGYLSFLSNLRLVSGLQLV